MPQGDIIAVSEQFTAALQAREVASFEQMTSAYLQIERRLLADYELLLQQIAEQGLSPGKAVRLKRYQELATQLTEELNKYAQFSSQIISNEQAAFINLAEQQSFALTNAALPAGFPVELGTIWNQVPFDALEAMVGFAGDGSPLLPAMVTRFGETVAPAVNDMLVRGVALGWNPRKTVTELRKVFDDKLLGNSLTWARTEQLRAHR
ncbi:unnamed protein product, partial [marine sediment metagenome]